MLSIILIDINLNYFSKGVIELKKIVVKTAKKKETKKGNGKYIVCVGKNF